MNKEKEHARSEEDLPVNQETLNAIAEGHRIANDPDAPAYHDMDSLIKSLES